MIKDKNLKQEGGEKSTNVQGKNVTINHGISYKDAKEIALDVFKSNFLELSKNAADLAKARAEELIDTFLQKLELEKSKEINHIEDPDMQYAIYTAQKEFARSGEKDLEDMLVSILLERISEPKNSLKKIVLNEAIEIAPKLTNQQLDTLTLIFLIQESKSQRIRNEETLVKYLTSLIVPFLKDLTKEKSCYQHLEYTGCCSSIGIPQSNLSQYFINRYRGVFSKGFTKERFEELSGDKESLSTLLIKCYSNNSLYQLNAINEDELKTIVIKNIGEPETLFLQLKSLFNTTTMNIYEANNYLIGLVPEMKRLIETWEKSYMCGMSPTSVGIALAFINLKRKTDIEFKLSDWIK